MLGARMRRGIEVPIDEDSLEQLDGMGVVDTPDAAIYMLQLLDDLEPEDVELLRLHAIGYSTKEISARMRLDPNAVDVRWFRLKEKVRAGAD